jgi:hypothetical protein
MFVETNDLTEPIRRYQVRPVETNAQVTTLIQELQRILLPPLTGQVKPKPPATTVGAPRELFNERGAWDRLQKIGEWQIDEDSRVFHGEGEHKYLLSHFIYGRKPFRIIGRLRFTFLRPLNDTAAVNSGVVFGWRSVGDVRRYYHLMFTGAQVLLEIVGAQGGPEFRDFQHIDEGVPFALESGQYYNFDLSVDNERLTVRIDGAEIYSVTISEEASGRVGIRPWRCRIESDRFEVKEIH